MRERLLRESRHVVESEFGCWLWPSNRSQAPYRKYYVAFKSDRYLGELDELRYGWDNSRPLDHLCRNTRCVNPWHLEPVSAGENVRRGAQGRRSWVANPMDPWLGQTTYESVFGYPVGGFVVRAPRDVYAMQKDYEQAAALYRAALNRGVAADVARAAYDRALAGIARKHGMAA